jgi:hypothetical protein
VCLVCGVERVRKGEPSAKRLVIGRVNVNIVCFERCSKNKIYNEPSRFVRNDDIDAYGQDRTSLACHIAQRMGS